MTVHLFQTVLTHSSGLPKDAVVNTWHFDSLISPGVTDYDNVRDMLKDFFTVAVVGFDAISTFIPNTMSGQWLVKAYNLSDPKPRAPVYESSFSTSLSSGDALPHEVSLVMSFQAARSSGLTQARRRNRKYLGPFKESANGATGRPSTALMNAVRASGQDLLDSARAAASWNWVAFSDTNNAAYAIADGWVDDAWDTQRRRGVSPTTRQTFD